MAPGPPGEGIDVILDVQTYGVSGLVLESGEISQTVDEYLAWGAKGPKGIDAGLPFADNFAMQRVIGVMMEGRNFAQTGPVQIMAQVYPWAATTSNGIPSLESQVQLTLNSLRRPSLDVLYLHGVPAEHRMPLEDALAICNGLIKEGKAQQLGLSNFPAWEVVHIYHICKQNGWALPKVCQVVYNCVQREAEAEIIPALRALGMRCGATDVFAGGLLMDQPHPANAGLIRCQVCPKCFDTKFYRDMHVARRHSKPNSLARVTNESLEPVASPRLSMSKVPDAEGMEATWKDGSIRAQRIIHMSCQRAQLDMRRVALHWLRAHSALRAGDMVLLNCSSSKDLVELLQQWATATKPLPGPLLVALDKGWVKSAQAVAVD